MFFYKTVRIRSYERGLLFRDGEFIRPLTGPRKVRIPLWQRRRTQITVIDATKTKFEHPMLDILLQNSELRSMLAVLDLTDTHRALVWRDGRIFAIVGPGTHAF